MRRFTCQCQTDQPLFFENDRCLSCGREAGWCFQQQDMLVTEATETPGLLQWQTQLYCRCANHAQGACNALVAVEPGYDPATPILCFACHFNQNIPDLSIDGHADLWSNLEQAKRRLLYTLMALDLPLPDKQQSPQGLSFHFLNDKDAADHFRTPLTHMGAVFTGHSQGDITINLAEADDVARHRMRVSMGEQYRTLLGHFRHEIGHFYWDLLIRDNPELLSRFAELFGDPGLSYQAALDAHYQRDPADTSWQTSFISAYATMHPWEDWAETFSHYLHMIDTLETARSWEIRSHMGLREETTASVADMALPQDGPGSYGIGDILDNWLHLSVILNALNRSMGQDDAYPFVVVEPVQEKLAFVHEVLLGARVNSSVG